MKKIIPITLLVFTILSCNQEPKDYSTINGSVKNLTEDIDSVAIFDSSKAYKKLIAVQPDGTFGDTLKVEEGKYQFKIGDEYGIIYLKKDDEVRIVTDYKDFDQQLVFEGNNESAKISNTYINNYKLSSNYLNDDALILPQNQFDSIVTVYNNNYNKFKKDNNDIPAFVWKELDEDKERNLKGFKEYYKKSKEIKDKFTGKTSPSFAMESIDGNIVKLSDFKGKIVYIDVWATWCGPCKREIPALKELEEKYKNKNIVFVSMSIDEPKDKEKWKKFVKDENLQGVQIFAQDAWKSDFVQSYEIQGIPRFILVGPEGEIVNPDAPRPSNEALIKLFDDLNI